MRKRLIKLQFAAQENKSLTKSLRYVSGPKFPQDYRPVTAEIISKLPSQFEQRVVLSAGSADGIKDDDPVLTADGLVGKISKVASHQAQVTLLTDEDTAVSAIDIDTRAEGIVRHGHGPGTSLFLDKVPKSEHVATNNRIVTAGWHQGSLQLHLSEGHPDRDRLQRELPEYRPVRERPDHAVRRLLLARLRDRPGQEEMIALDGVKAGALLFVAAVIQVSILNGVTVLGGTPDLLLVTLCAVALLRGSMFGAVGGFFAGIVVDTATLDTMGVTALLLTLVGYWIGRYGETTGRGRYAPLLSVGVVTILYAFAAAARPLHARRGRIAGGRAAGRASAEPALQPPDRASRLLVL